VERRPAKVERLRDKVVAEFLRVTKVRLERRILRDKAVVLRDTYAITEAYRHITV
jgi:hypothetical protein